MIQVAEFDINTDQIAFYREIQRKLNGPRQTAPTRVAPTAKHTANQPELTVETRQKDELFQGHADSSESVNTSAEVKAVMLVPSFEEILSAFHLFAKEEREAPTLRDLLHKVSEVFGIPLNEIKSERREIRLVNARHAFFFLARGLTDRSFPQIGLYCGGRDHTTVIHGARRAEKLMDQNESFRALVNAVSSHFGAAA